MPHMKAPRLLRIFLIVTAIHHAATQQAQAIHFQKSPSQASWWSTTHRTRRQARGALHPWDGAKAMKLVSPGAILHKTIFLEVDLVQANRAQIPSGLFFYLIVVVGVCLAAGGRTPLSFVAPTYRTLGELHRHGSVLTNGYPACRVFGPSTNTSCSLF